MASFVRNIHNMSQAITLCDAEIDQLLPHLATVKHEARNREMVLLTHW